MKRYTVQNDFDPNDTFEVEAENDLSAALLALMEMGYNLSTGEEIPQEVQYAQDVPSERVL